MSRLRQRPRPVARPTRDFSGRCMTGFSPIRAARTRVPSPRHGLRSIAQAAGLDMTSYDSCMAAGDKQASVQSDTASSFSAGIQSTPTIKINGALYGGQLTVPGLSAAIQGAVGTSSPAVVPISASSDTAGSQLLAMISGRVPARKLFGVHPAIILAALDTVGLLVAGYLSAVELSGGVPTCGIISGCEEVARSQYNNFLGIPVAVFGVLLIGSSARASRSRGGRPTSTACCSPTTASRSSASSSTAISCSCRCSSSRPCASGA